MSISIESVYLTSYTKLVNGILSCSGVISGPIVYNWIVQCMWPTLDDPFALATTIDKKQNMYNVLKNCPIDVINIEPSYMIGLLFHKNYKFTHEQKRGYDEFIIEEIFTDEYEHRIKIRVFNIINPVVTPLFDIDKLIYSASGLSTKLGFDFELGQNALYHICTYMGSSPIGIDAKSIQIRKHNFQQIMQMFEDGWFIRNIPFTHILYNDFHKNKKCPICQEFIKDSTDSSHIIQISCKCQICFHVGCFEPFVNVALSEKTFFKCPTCRDELNF